MNIIPVEYQSYYVIGVVVLLFFVIYRELLKPAVAFLMATLLLLVSGVITPKEVLEGFSNQSIATIVLLILITAGIRSNFNIEIFLDKAFGRAKTYRGFLASMMSKVAILSSIVNNTPVVVLMTPYVFNWGKRHNISPSKLLIPLSYSTIIGGMITIIGTSTTLVLNGFLIENKLNEINAISLLVIGVSVMVMCLLFLLLFSNYLLPNRKDIIEEFEANKREYLIEKRLSEDSPLVGKTVVSGGLRNLNGVYLVEIVRNDKIISPVSPDEEIEANDILIFAGNTDTIVDLTTSDIGVELPSNLSPSDNERIQVVEAVISANSSLISKSIKESNFRARYDAAVVAIHRNGEKLSGKIGRLKIKAGDVLLMYVGSDFKNRVDLYKDLYVISGEDKEIRPRKNNHYKLTVLAATGFVLITTQLFSLFVSLLIVFAAMVGFKLITLKNIKRDLDVNLVVILVLSLALGEAMIKSGAGQFLAQSAMSVLSEQQPIVILGGLMVFTAMLTSFITNIGAVAIAFPLTLALTQALNIDGEPFYLGLAFAASAAFLTPIGYQTNLIIYGPGGYTFKDFLRIGFPVTFIYLLTALSVIGLIFKDVLFI
ncbi:SLC13 family permease [Fulvivirga sp. RKSG066]|uniref:SLC13 family permease n=1 Tax=Fulvivirga aurantia TaxID=2529383 RepID=UPI0012BC18D0|nr:SLC13 family permease [Fulvivirga aurantia]MTI20921.1 SLC13 family permease [Fulvivirga aurantia]